MDFSGVKKASTELVLNVLKEYTDENHYLTQTEIADKVQELYDLELDRRTVASALTLLEDLDYDIDRRDQGGVALLSREFESSEVTFLIDAIFSSKSIPGNQAVKLAEKVSSCLSRYQRKSYAYLNKSTEVSRTSNKEVFFSIESINEAIQKGKWISFKYIEFDDDGNLQHSFRGWERKVSPCYLVNNFGRYYLLAYRESKKNPDIKGVESYRLDYIEEIKVLEDRDRIDPRTLDEFKNYPSISDYINEHIYLFNGRTVEATLEVDKGKSLKYIYDWFGDNAKVYKDEDKLMVRIKCNENALFFWILQYSMHIKVTSPKALVDRVKEATNEMAEMYKNVE